jgi:hypothetical protein
MGFEQLHPDPRVRRGHGRARDLRAAYLQDLVSRLMRPAIRRQLNGATTADATGAGADRRQRGTILPACAGGSQEVRPLGDGAQHQGALSDEA